MRRVDWSDARDFLRRVVDAGRRYRADDEALLDAMDGLGELSRTKLVFLVWVGEQGAGELDTYDEHELALALHRIASPSIIGGGLVLHDGVFTMDWRIRAVRAQPGLFRDFFAPRLGDRLDRERTGDGIDLSSVCAAWFDECVGYPFGTAGAPDRPGIQAAWIDAIRQVAAIPSLACRESALRGLMTATAFRVDHVRPVIDDFLASGCPAPLAEMAERVRRACGDG